MRSTSTSRSSSRSARRSAAPAVRASAVRSGLPLRVPGAGGPLVLLELGAQHDRGQAVHLVGGRDDERGLGRVALVRHGGRAAAGTVPDLADLGASQRDDVGGDPAHAAGDDRQRGRQLGRPDAGRVPGQWGSDQPQSGRQLLDHRRTCATERRQRARRSSELDGQPLGGDAGDQRACVDQAHQPGRRREPERDGHGVLAQRAPDGDVAPVALGQRGRGRRGSLQLVVQSGQRPFGQQHQRRVDDVLARGTDVHRRPRLRRHRGPQVGDERDDRVAGLRRPPSQVGQIEAVGLATRS